LHTFKIIQYIIILPVLVMDASRKIVVETTKKIRRLEIQGASQVRKAVVNALRESVEKSKAESAEELREELKKNMLLLASARPTEPETRTALRIILRASHRHLPLEELKAEIIEACSKYERNRKNAMRKIAELGSEALKDCSIIFTHCHSHTVEEILKRMHEKGYLQAVICTETRPRYQGRITASNLTKAGIACTMIVDSAARMFVSKADAFLTGCDAILASGAIVNKIGTSLISLAAKKANVPHYVASSSHCFDPATYYGKEEVIEERPASEVWERRLRNLTIRNPAFDITEAELVKALICEKGVLTPKRFVKLMVKELALDKKPYVSLIDMLRE
jgi:ribose 1,5-bisphosphate isomerase